MVWSREEHDPVIFEMAALLCVLAKDRCSERSPGPLGVSFTRFPRSMPFGRIWCPLVLGSSGIYGDTYPVPSVDALRKDMVSSDRRAIPDTMAWRHRDFDVYDAFPDDDFSLQDVQSLTEKIIDLRHVPFGLLFGVGLATTWDFPGFFPVFKYTRGNVVTVSEYLQFPFLSGISIVKGAAVLANHPIGQNTTPPFPTDQPILDKTDSQREVEVEDPNVVDAKEKKKAQVARAATKKKESRKRGTVKGEVLKQKKKIPVGVKSASPNACVLAILKGSFDPVSPFISGNNDGEPNALNDENRSASHSPRGSAETLRRVSPLGVLLYIFLGGPSGRDALVDARLDLKHNAKLYTNAVSRYHALKEEHTGCEKKVKALEEERNNLSVVKRDQALRIKELEAEVARKDSALVATKQTSAEGAKNIRTGWGKGVSEGRTDKEIMAVLHKAEHFDGHSDKKLYSMYDKLFEKEYPYIEKIASRYRHSVVDLLKVHLDPAPSEGTSTPTISKALGASCAPPLQEKT
ncbi:hypothetical protein Tco_0370122 [Tanacetum coccineum]